MGGYWLDSVHASLYSMFIIIKVTRSSWMKVPFWELDHSSNENPVFLDNADLDLFLDHRDLSLI